MEHSSSRLRCSACAARSRDGWPCCADRRRLMLREEEESMRRLLLGTVLSERHVPDRSRLLEPLEGRAFLVAHLVQHHQREEVGRVLELALHPLSPLPRCSQLLLISTSCEQRPEMHRQLAHFHGSAQRQRAIGVGGCVALAPQREAEGRAHLVDENEVRGAQRSREEGLRLKLLGGEPQDLSPVLGYLEFEHPPSRHVKQRQYRGRVAAREDREARCKRSVLADEHQRRHNPKPLDVVSGGVEVAVVEVGREAYGRAHVGIHHHLPSLGSSTSFQERLRNGAIPLITNVSCDSVPPATNMGFLTSSLRRLS
mmetsp:Transcript_68639/g.162811  ORF Transcript_68639/g.162811 Transcript_68639/m.162811 type:complete len:312 (+) Transcript_68639:309-1244(+)